MSIGEKNKTYQNTATVGATFAGYTIYPQNIASCINMQCEIFGRRPNRDLSVIQPTTIPIETHHQQIKACTCTPRRRRRRILAEIHGNHFDKKILS